jgi:glycine cleavage system H protein
MSTARFDELAFPADLHYLIEHQVWARLAPDGTATVGITSLGIALAGEIYMCRAKAAGTAIEQGKSVAVVELAKSIVSVKSPLSGTVVETNPRLPESPEIVHADPYGEGWIARIRPEALDHERLALLHGEGVRAAMADHARLYRID